MLGAGCIGLLGIVAAHHFGIKCITVSYRYKFQADLALKIGQHLGTEVVTVKASDLTQHYKGELPFDI